MLRNTQLSRSEYQSKYYPKQCGTFYCGFDLSSPYEKNDVDFFGVVVGRIGVALREIRVWGVKGDLVFALAPVLARWPKNFDLVSPDGNSVSRPETMSYLFETTIEI